MSTKVLSGLSFSWTKCYLILLDIFVADLPGMDDDQVIWLAKRVDRMINNRLCYPKFLEIEFGQDNPNVQVLGALAELWKLVKNGLCKCTLRMKGNKVIQQIKKYFDLAIPKEYEAVNVFLAN